MADENNIPERLAVVETKVENLNEKVDEIKNKLNDIDTFLRSRLIDEIHDERKKHTNKVKEYGVYASIIMSTLSIVAILIVHIL